MAGRGLGIRNIGLDVNQSLYNNPYLGGGTVAGDNLVPNYGGRAWALTDATYVSPSYVSGEPFRSGLSISGPSIEILSPGYGIIFKPEGLEFPTAPVFDVFRGFQYSGRTIGSVVGVQAFSLNIGSVPVGADKFTQWNMGLGRYTGFSLGKNMTTGGSYFSVNFGVGVAAPWTATSNW